jgi:hypothetical protein
MRRYIKNRRLVFFYAVSEMASGAKAPFKMASFYTLFVA